MAAGLFPDCVIPGCIQPVAEHGDTCETCQAAFGDMLKPTGVALTAEQIDARDNPVRDVHRARRYMTQEARP